MNQENKDKDNTPQEFDNQLIYEVSEKDLLDKNNQCQACQRTGFPLFLVRKSIIPKQYKKDFTWSTNMDISSCIPLSNSQYVYRTLREGYVYILAEKKEAPTQFDIIAYEVTNSGAFREREFKDIKGSRPKELPITQCIGQSHHLKAKFITVDNKRYDKIWVAYSFTRLSKEAIEHYQQSPDHLKKRFVAVDLTQTDLTKMATGNRSFAVSEFINKSRHLFEIEYQHSVTDYFDEKKEKSATPLEAIEDKLKFDNSKGVFAGTDMANLASLPMEGILGYFSDKFSTAHHFTPLADTAAKVNETFNETINNYGSQVAAIELDDSFGIAEELSIQRRQLLSPIINEFINSDANRMALLKQKFNIGNKDNSNEHLRQDIETQEKESMKKSELSKLYKAMYSQNILDLDNNKKYRDMNQWDDSTNTESLKKLCSLAMTGWFSNRFATYAKAEKRAETMVDFFKEQLADVGTKPLVYFKPEMSYARKQKSQIEAFKQQLLSSQQQAIADIDDGHPDWVFVFYNSQNVVKIENPFVINNEINKLYNYPEFAIHQPQKRITPNNDETIKTLDNFNALGIVGLKRLSDRFRIPYAPDSIYAYNSRTGLLFKYLKYIGMEDYPLGDYRIIHVNEKDKPTLLELYENAGKNNSNCIQLNPYGETVDSVYVVEFTEIKNKVAEYNAKHEWSRQNEKRIYTPSEEAFTKTDNAMRDQLMNYVKTISKDYFDYCNAIFNNDANQFPFWLYECEPDLSDSHINYLFSLLIIFDCNYMGNIELEEQEDFFASLFRDKNTIYTHLLEGHEYSLFNIASGETDAPELTQQVKNILYSTSKNETKKAVTPGTVKALKFIDDKHELITGIKYKYKYKNKYIKGLSTKNNVTLGAYLQGELVQITLNNSIRKLSRSLDDLVLNDAINTHILKSMNAFSPGIVKQYTVTVPINKVPYVIQDMEENFTKLMGINKIKAQTIRPSNPNNQKQMNTSKYAQHSGSKETMTYKYFVYFNDKKQQIEYEGKLINNKDNQYKDNANVIQDKNKTKGDSIFICDASQAEENDLVSAFKYQAELNRKTALVESSISMALTGVTILSQYYQLAELESQLKACLSTNQSQALYNQLQYNIKRTHIQMTLNLSVGALTLGKFGAIYLNDGSKYRIFNKMSAGIGKINAIISIIDSVGTLAKASGALKRGDEGSAAFYVTSAVQLIVAVVGIICPVSIFVTLAIEVCTMIISLFFEYDDGLMWDDMSKWLNRTMLGKFGRNDLLPPYPITDTGLYLSDQDFYLASSGGTLNLLSTDINEARYAEEHLLKMQRDETYRQSFYKKYPGNSWYRHLSQDDFRKLTISDITTIHRAGMFASQSTTTPSFDDEEKNLPVKAKKSRGCLDKMVDLYLTLRLPNYNENISVFEGHVTISHHSGASPTTFSFTGGDKSINIQSFTSTSGEYLKAEPNDGMIRERLDYYDFAKDSTKNTASEQVDQPWMTMINTLLPKRDLESLPEDIAAQTVNTKVENEQTENEQEQVGLYSIQQLLGRVVGGHYVTCYVSYWPEGEYDETGTRRVPFLYAHQHNVNDLMESVTEWFNDKADIFLL